MELILRPWAKINLYLEILAREENGYHQVVTVLQPIALFDELSLTRNDGGVQVNCRIAGLPAGQRLPAQSDNLVAKAAKIFFSKINETPAVKIDLLKRIPIGGGLGGGSSDAAAVLTGLNTMWGNVLTEGELSRLGASLGMDVVFFFQSVPAFCHGRGEIIAERWSGTKFWLVLVNPGGELSTASVYRKWDEQAGQRLTLTRDIGDYNILSLFIPAFKKYYSNIYKLVDYIRNDLESPAIELFPELKYILDIVKKAGALRSFISGSGSTVCGLTATEEEAQQVAVRIKELGSDRWWIKVVAAI